jgi:hypothetical protein
VGERCPPPVSASSGAPSFQALLSGLFLSKAALTGRRGLRAEARGPGEKGEKGVVVVTSQPCLHIEEHEGIGCGFVCVSVFSWKVYK